MIIYLPLLSILKIFRGLRIGISKMKSTINDLVTRDLAHLWHPCAQMKDYEQLPPMVVKEAKGSYITLENGQRLIDATSSWWCKLLGHGHPRLKQALLKQVEHFEHVMLTHLTHEPIVVLSERLAQLIPRLQKVFYANDGSCAVEIAMKMSMHAHQLQGQQHRQHFVALHGSYHGETCGALAVSDLGLYRQPYEPLLTTKVEFIETIPYVSGREDPLWKNCEAYWPAIETKLNSHAEQLTAVIVEPILQGAGGMRIYSRDFLHRLWLWARERGVHFIADEILTGFGRTGLPLACQHAGIEPDFLCLSKSITSGWLPLSAVLATNEIYELFYDDYENGKSFLHSHTYAGNPLAAAVALETLAIIEDEKLYDRVQWMEKKLISLLNDVAQQTGKLQNIRGIGGVAAADLVVTDQTQRTGFKIYKKAAELGALLRPLGNTLYWLLPLNATESTMWELAKITSCAVL